MSVSSDTIQAWPAARQGATQAIRHPAWEAARNAVLDLAAEGPVTIALVGEAGTGKTWMLRELAGSFSDHGFPSTMLMQGDLPASVSGGAALLVDEALRMPDAALDELLQQQHGVVVLADMERLGERVAARVADPVVIRLRPLEADEVGEFAAEWLHRAELPSTALDQSALTRLAQHGCGSVRLVTKLLGAAVAARKSSGKATVSAADLDRMVDFRLRGLDLPPEPVPAPPPSPAAPTEPAVVPAPPPIVRARRRPTPAIMAGIAVAACAVLVWGLRPTPSVPAAPTQPVAQTMPLPPLQPADLPTPNLATAPDPVLAPIATAALASVPAPRAVATLEPAESSRPALAMAEVPGVAVTTPSSPRITPTLPPTALDPAAAPHLAAVTPTAAEPARPPRAAGGPGMVLIAQRGETLQSMYNDIYRDRAAPPFADVLAANPRPFKPGAIVIFPEPPGGWSRHR